MPTSSTRSECRPIEVGEEPGFAGLGGEVAALDQSGEFLPAELVEGTGFGGQFAVVVNANGYAIGCKVGKPTGPGFELHDHARIVAEGGVF